MLLLVTLSWASSLTEVQDALAAGRCSEAAEAAKAWTAEDPTDPKAWRGVGDAARCTGNTPAALAAYRQALALRPEPGLQALVDSLAADYATVTLKIEGADAEQPPTVTVQDIGRTVRANGSALRDLSPSTKLVLEVSGEGYEPAAAPFTTGGPGSTKAVKVEVTFLGRGVVSLTGVGEGISVLVDGRPVEAGETSLVTGDHALVVKGATGERSVPLVIAEGETQSIDVSQLLPAAVTLLAIPEGTTLTFTAGPEPMDPVTTPRDEGELDEDLGIRIAPLQFEGLAAGEWVYTFEHPLLGSMEGKFFAVGGQVSAEPVAWRQLEGVATLTTAYTQYKATSGSGLGKDGWMALGGAAVGLAGVGLGAAKLFVAIEARSDAADAADRYAILVEDGDIETANLVYAQEGELRGTARSGLVVGTTVTGLGVAGVAVAVVTGKRFLANRDTTQWEPFDQ